MIGEIISNILSVDTFRSSHSLNSNITFTCTFIVVAIEYIEWDSHWFIRFYSNETSLSIVIFIVTKHLKKNRSLLIFDLLIKCMKCRILVSFFPLKLQRFCVIIIIWFVILWLNRKQFAIRFRVFFSLLCVSIIRFYWKRSETKLNLEWFSFFYYFSQTPRCSFIIHWPHCYL